MSVGDLSDVCFFITAFDQIKEVKFTIDMLRNKWESTRKSPIVLVISGDFNRDVVYNDDSLTRVVHLDDMVGDRFQVLVSTSIMRQIEHGMIEVRDLERQHGDILSIVHLHGDILLLGEEGFINTLNQWRESNLPVAADNVGPNGPYDLELFGGKYNLRFCGQEIMPQLFAVDHAFCKATNFMYSMPVFGDLEKISTEWALIGNLHRATANLKDYVGKIDEWNQDTGPYYSTYSGNVHTVARNRSQWALHKHWGGFCHFGNSLHFSKEQREKRNKTALIKYGLDLSAWGD